MTFIIILYEGPKHNAPEAIHDEFVDADGLLPSERPRQLLPLAPQLVTPQPHVQRVVVLQLALWRKRTIRLLWGMDLHSKNRLNHLHFLFCLSNLISFGPGSAPYFLTFRVDYG